LALRKRLKASRTSAGVQGFGFGDFFAAGLAADFLTTAFAGFLTAREAAKAFVVADYGPAEDFRVQRSKAPAD